MVAAAWRIVASPFYSIAFVLHLLCALFTIIAQKIAGDESGPTRGVEAFSFVVLCCAMLSAVPLFSFEREDTPPDLVSLLVPQMPRPDWRSIKTGFTKDQAWEPALIRLNACVFAERAVRHALESSSVQFDPCGDGGRIRTTIDDDFFETTVSGVARVDDKPKAFTVTLNHYPPSVTEWGYITTGIEIEREANSAQIACAKAEN
jgi:hypothetical protein